MRALCHLVLFAFLLVGCAPDIDPPSELVGLRVLAIQKDKPYAKPTDSVTLTMLRHDVDGRNVIVWWFGGCRNPPGDLFHRCFDDVASLGLPVVNDTFVLDDIPDDIIAGRPPSADPRFPRYGLIYVFFAVCAGEKLAFLPQPEDELRPPIGCFDADGKQLGARDFVAGYTAIYVYDDFTNDNPTPTGFLVRGVPLDETCTDPDCADVPADPPACDNPGPHCVATCADDGEPSCPGIEIQPIIAETEAETDAVSAAAYGREVGEQMWINYYVDSGSVDSSVRLLNDATKGWNAEHETKFRAPAEPGPINVWAVVHDNRGGVGWVRTQLHAF
jgi:hypothetical protein